MQYALKVESVSMKYQAKNGEVEALRDISLLVPEGEFLSIVGPSGCGKSTLLSIISGLEKSSSGNIKVFGSEDPRIGYMFQKDNLFPWRTIFDNILLGLEIRKELTEENISYVEEMLDRYGLSDFKNKYPQQLSGGMRQRCALIRTLATKPDILLLDEPFSALDYQTRLAVSDDIYSIIKHENKTAIMVSHDISECISMSDTVVVLSKRPGMIKKIFSIDGFLAKTPLKRRDEAAFSAYFNAIWRELDVHI
ncbi:MAG: ABC transporter ATP-binding protein [Christensenellaceae bacterium]|nr:ABC transporter ATP-binding protein [Christensenellaceae bacterium]MBR3842977.1 ABC transporter ATP-binding protein [Christensenellaceae bacterium]